jgi:hypothetical protein
MSEGANGSAILAGNPAGDGAAGVASSSAPVVTAVTDGGSPPSANAGSWYDNIEDTDLRGYVQNKGWQSPKDVADGYRNLEKLLGGEKLPMPKGADDAEGWSRVYDALGRPQEASGYKINLMEGADPALAGQVQSKFHELGLSEAQGNALAEWWNQTQQGTLQSFIAQSAQKSEADLNSLKSEWGGAYDENVEFGRRAAREYGLNAEKLGKIEQALGTGEMMKLFAQIGRAQGEGSFEGGGNSNPFGMTPEAAKQRISALTKDPNWTSAYLSGDADAQAEMARLQKLANPE